MFWNETERERESDRRNIGTRRENNGTALKITISSVARARKEEETDPSELVGERRTQPSAPAFPA